MTSVHHSLRYLVFALLSVPGMANAQASHTSENIQNKAISMNTTQNNKEVIRTIYEQCLNKRNMAPLKELISEDYVGIKGKKGVAAFQEPVAELIAAFPDVQWTLTELVGDGDKVAVAWKLQGTHAAQYQHHAATGKTVTGDGMAVFEFQNGKVTGSRVLTDRLGFLQQLDALPMDLTLIVSKKAKKHQVSFIDKFHVPAQSKQEFLERVTVNRNLLKKLPGFVEDHAYERTDENGDLIFITVAIWQNEDAVKKAKEAVQLEYKKEGFDMPQMMKRLNITMDRAMYSELLQP
jgi:predicted ester cyclase/heme-degrading monooxygenase HmoA